MNSKYKNIIISAMAAGIFYVNIVEGMPGTKTVFGVCVMFLGCMALLQIFDGLEEIQYETKKVLSKRRFCGYKNWLAGMVERQRTKGKDEAYLKNFITNFITRDKRYAFSGNQIAELMSLAANVERSA